MDNLEYFNQLLQQAPDHDDHTYPFWLAQQFFKTDSTTASTTDTIAASTPLTDTTIDATTVVSTPLTATTAVSTPLTATTAVLTPLTATTATSQTGVNSKRKRKTPLKGEPSAKLKAHIKHCAEKEEHLQEEKLEEKKRKAKEETTAITGF